jgi:hypothetical protein
MDFTAYNGSVESSNCVGDLRWDASVRLEHSGALRLYFSEDDDRYAATVAFGGTDRKTSITASGQVVAESNFVADPGAEHRVVFANVDNRAELSVDGVSILTWDRIVPLNSVDMYTERSGAELGVEGTPATFSRIRLDRDLYYLHDRGEPQYVPQYDVPDESYFCLGDNSQNSRDSRYWGSVPVDNLVGNAVVIWWPLSSLVAVY